MAGGKRKVYATINCEKHGTADCRRLPTKRVKVPMPITKKQRLNAQCPYCKKEDTNE